MAVEATAPLSMFSSAGIDDSSPFRATSPYKAEESAIHVSRAPVGRSAPNSSTQATSPSSPNATVADLINRRDAWREVNVPSSYRAAMSPTIASTASPASCGPVAITSTSWAEALEQAADALVTNRNGDVPDLSPRTSVPL